MLFLRPKALLFALLLWSTPLVAINPLEQVAREVEELNMQRLRAQQMRSDVTIDAFKTDGCSGGMSEAWKSVAGVWPEFAQSVGASPPWEYCCVAHDRDYWRGETQNGYDQRLQADLELKHCVEQAGIEQSEALAERTGLAQAELRELFDLAAEFMYQAVRLGGGPCTGLAWRWGHGWPRCELDTEPLDENLIRVELQAIQAPGKTARGSAPVLV